MPGRAATRPRSVEQVQVPDVKDPNVQRALDALTRAVQALQSRQALEVAVLSGPVAPEGRVTASPGTLYVHVGDNVAKLYVKESGSDNTGWTAK